MRGVTCIVTIMLISLFSPFDNISADSLSPESFDTDNDRIDDRIDDCPDTVENNTINENGCSSNQIDSDQDGFFDNLDRCIHSPSIDVDDTGCAQSDTISIPDSDGDGVGNDVDGCLGTPPSSIVQSDGCYSINYCNSQYHFITTYERECRPPSPDSDGDQIPDHLDACGDTALGKPVRESGCSASQLDSDQDGIPDSSDECPFSSGDIVDSSGCTSGDTIEGDNDEDSIPNSRDECLESNASDVVNSAGCATVILDELLSVRICPWTVQAFERKFGTSIEDCYPNDPHLYFSSVDGANISEITQSASFKTDVGDLDGLELFGTSGDKQPQFVGYWFDELMLIDFNGSGFSVSETYNPSIGKDNYLGSIHGIATSQDTVYAIDDERRYVARGGISGGNSKRITTGGGILVGEDLNEISFTHSGECITKEVGGVIGSQQDYAGCGRSGDEFGSSFISNNGDIVRISCYYDCAIDFDQIVATGPAREITASASDLDNDGDLDVVIGQSDGDVLIYLADNGYYTYSQKINAGDSVNDIAIVDIDNNGFVDILVATDDKDIIINNDGGVYSIQWRSWARSSPTNSIHAIDIDGDGDLDVITATDSGVIRIYVNEIEADLDGNGIGDSRELQSGTPEYEEMVGEDEELACGIIFVCSIILGARLLKRT